MQSATLICKREADWERTPATLETSRGRVVFLRFQDFPGEQMQRLAAYLDRGGPIVGLRMKRDTTEELLAEHTLR